MLNAANNQSALYLFVMLMNGLLTLNALGCMRLTLWRRKTGYRLPAKPEGRMTED